MFTDIEGSTERWDADPEAMRQLLEHHDRTVGEVIEAHQGVLAKRTGDGAIALFDATLDAVACALDLQRRIAAGPREYGLDAEPLKVRVGLHRGVVEARDGDFFGPPMHRAARIMSAGNGGQVVVSHMVAEHVRLADAGSHSHHWQLVDCGMHRLKGFHEPERLSLVTSTAVTPGSGPGDSRQLRTANATAGWLPPGDPATFVGRERELAEIPGRLGPGRIVTLVGAGGVGKTRLAIHVAQRARPAFPDGAWFVDLAAVTDPARVLPAIADALSITGEKAVSLVEPVRQALAARQALLLLDNCEHVLEAVAETVRSVMSEASPASLLCTSQRDLGVLGEAVVQIGPLNFDDDVGSSPAGHLFVQQAQRADPAFVLDERTTPAVRTICHRLEGLPLAIELAASRVRVMTVDEIAERLGTTFDLLRSRDHPDRHRTLSAAISWSVGLLADAERELLFELSVFNGTFTWAAAAAVTGRDDFDVADAVDELVRRSLLIRTGEALRMLVPLRLYCAEQLAGTERAADVQRGHAEWAAASVPRPVDDLDASLVATRLDQLVASIDDLHVAHRWLLAHDPARAAGLALDLVDLWINRARCQEAMAWLAACDTDDVPAEARVEVLGWIAGFGWTVGRNDEGEDAARRALEIAERAGLPLPVFAATRLSVRLAFSNRTAEAVELADAAEQALRSGNGDPTRLLGPLAVVRAVAGDMGRASQLADEGVAAARQVGVLRLLGAMANRLLVGLGDESLATLSEEVATLARTVGRTSALAHAISSMAHLARKAGDVHGFLSGLGEFADLMMQDEPTSVVGTLQLVPGPAADRHPREAAMLLGAVETLAEEYDHRGTDAELATRRDVTERLERVLGADELDRAVAEGRGMRLGEAVDLLHWLADATAPSEDGTR